MRGAAGGRDEETYSNKMVSEQEAATANPIKYGWAYSEKKRPVKKNWVLITGGKIRSWTRELNKDTL